MERGRRAAAGVGDEHLHRAPPLLDRGEHLLDRTRDQQVCRNDEGLARKPVCHVAQLFVAARGQRDPVALPGQPGRDGSANAAAGTGHQAHPRAALRDWARLLGHARHLVSGP